MTLPEAPEESPRRARRALSPLLLSLVAFVLLLAGAFAGGVVLRRALPYDLDASNGHASFSPDGDHLAVAGSASVRIHAATDGHLERELVSDEIGFVWLRYSHRGDRLIAGDSGLGRVRVWDVTTGEVLLSVEGGGATAALDRPLAFSPDDTLVAISRQRAVDVWSIAEKKSVLSVEAPTSPTCVAFSRDGTKLRTSFVSSDAAIKTWSFPKGEPLETREATPMRPPVLLDGELFWTWETAPDPLRVAWCQDSTLVSELSIDSAINWVDATERRDLFALGGVAATVRRADGSVVASFPPPGVAGNCSGIAISPAGDRLAAVWPDRVRVYPIRP